MIIAVPREVVAGERRVALIPPSVKRLVEEGLEVHVQAGAGAASGHSDADYQEAGARIEPSAAALYSKADVMVGVQPPVLHPETGAHQAEMLSNLQKFNGEFLSQNIRIKEDSLFEDAYFEMADRFGGLGLYDEDNAIAFKPYTVRTVASKTIAVIGQAFPRTANANPQGFIPDWTFGIREDELKSLVGQIREHDTPDAVILLSHNGMDVDLKLASRVDGIDAILGGHTHDVVPVPVQVTTPDGGTCLVTNAGTNGKFAGVMDLDLGDGEVRGIQYHLLPIFEDLLEADGEMETYISGVRSSGYDENIVESRAENFRFNPARSGKSFEEILVEKLAVADRTLYRRGNFMGTWDQLICDAVRYEYDAEISLSPGFRWGTTVLAGEWITMEDVMTQTAITYGETYVREMTGEAILTILESVADNLFDPDPYFQSGGDMVRVGGLDYTIDPSRPLLERIRSAILDSGQALDPARAYRVAGWAVVGSPPDGRLVWDIVREYLLSQKGQDNVIRINKVYHPTLVGVSDNPGVSNYQGKLAQQG